MIKKFPSKKDIFILHEVISATIRKIYSIMIGESHISFRMRMLGITKSLGCKK